jgi:hypothetical protein
MSAREFDPHISIDPITHAKDGDYFIKQIEIEHLRRKIETPFKILAGNGINEEDVSSVSGMIAQPFLEYQKFVTDIRSWNSLYHLLNEAGPDRVHGLDSFFNIKKRMWNSALTTVSLVFPRNPFKEFSTITDGKKRTFPGLDENSYICLLDYVHSASKAFVLCPDVRLEKREDINTTQYLAFVDQSIKVLMDRNNRPIFAPLHIELSKKNLETILSHYKSLGYTNIWIDFDAKTCHGTYSSRLKTIIHLIDKIMGNSNTTLYFSHIKKEILPNIQENRAAASDILTQFYGADFIGTDREPWRRPQVDWNNDDALRELASKHNFSTKEAYLEAHVLHKHRIFDPDSYYYLNLDHYPQSLPISSSTLLKDNAVNQFLNSTLMHLEVERTKQTISETKSLKKYLNTKAAIQENPDIMDNIVVPQKAPDLMDFLGNL